MQLLAVSYVLPPNLYPQAIQIGRLLYHCPHPLDVVSGLVVEHANGLDCYDDFDERLTHKIVVPFNNRLSGILQKMAIYGLPFYGRCPDEFSGWIARAEAATIAYLAKSTVKPERLLTFGEPMTDHLLGLRLKKHLNIPWIAHFSDPWADNPFRKYFRLAHWVNRWQEKRVIKHADRIVFTSLETLNLVMRKYPMSWNKKAYVVPHGFDPVLYKSVKLSQRPHAIVVRYVGNFYNARTPEPLFKALLSIFNNSPSELEGVRVEIVGGVPSRMLKTDAFESLPANLVHVVPSVSYRKSLELMSEADLLLVIDAPTEELSVFLPSKLVDYLGAGVPIFGISPAGTSASLIKRLGGFVANPKNHQEVAEQLLKALAVCKERRATPCAHDLGDNAERNEYRIDNVTRKFYEIVEMMDPC
jgi:glycosyltransferase involved in cell wall biosynthesis